MITRRSFLQMLAAPIFLRYPFFRGEAGFPGDQAAKLIGAAPAVGRVTSATAELNIVSPSQARYMVEYGMSSESLTKRAFLEGSGSLTATLKELQPDARCYYRVRQETGNGAVPLPVEVQSFPTQKSRGAEFSFAVLADSHFGERIDEPKTISDLQETVANLAREDIDFVVLVGDEAYFDGDYDKDNNKTGVQSEEDAIHRYAMMRTLYASLMARLPVFLVLGNHDGEKLYRARNAGELNALRMRWATNYRKDYILNPRHDTYPEGGENDGWMEKDYLPNLAGDPGRHASPLENYYAWSWGDALFVVIDPYRYMVKEPAVPEDWTLGEKQIIWLEKTLAASNKRHKFILGHHLIGGAPYHSSLYEKGAGGRGGATFATVGEQGRIHEMMKRYGARFYLYGHDHAFVHSAKDEINYVSCGKSGFVKGRWKRPNWKKIYEGDFAAAPGYVLVNVSSAAVTLSYKISAHGNRPRDIFWQGRPYRLNPDNSVEVEDEVIGVINAWAPDDKKQKNLFKGGSFSGNRINLGTSPGKPTESVNVIYVGQTIYSRTF